MPLIKINTMQSIINELTEYLKTIEVFDKDAGQDAEQLHAYLIQLTNYMARANFLMAEYGRKFRQDKKQAYIELVKQAHDKQQYFAPSLAKDYIDALCHENGFIYDLAERLSRLCSHTIDAIRTVVSSLKSERQFSGYGT